MTPHPALRLLAPAVLAAGALLLPALASAERVVTRGGEVIIGDARFEGDLVIVTREDGSTVKIPRDRVERIELSPEEAEPAAPTPAEPPAEVPAPEAEAERQAEPPPSPRPPASRPPAWRPRYPPPPPPTPPPPYYRPPAPAPYVRERAYDQDGFALTVGYHRGMAIGGEYQLRPAKNFGVGFGAQLGLEPREYASFGTFGVTGRAYAGRAHRLALEVGAGLNAIDPFLGDCDPGDFVCAERSFGPEFSAGYQFVSDGGLVFETLMGFAVVTNERIVDEHGPLHPLFQISLGYLFH